MPELLDTALTMVGAVVTIGAIGVVGVRVWAWLVFHVFRRSPIKGFGIDLARGAERMRLAGWKLQLRGFVVGRVGFGIVIGTPPVWGCEECPSQFTSKAAVIAHEEEAHHAG